MAMLGIRKYLIGAVLGLLVGLWLGINIGNERPLWSNPFAEPSLTEKAQGVAKDVWQDAKKAAREKLKD